MDIFEFGKRINELIVGVKDLATIFRGPLPGWSAPAWHPQVQICVLSRGSPAASKSGTRFFGT